MKFCGDYTAYSPQKMRSKTPHTLTDEIITLYHQYEVDILILAESTKINKIRFIERLNSGQLRLLLPGK